MIRSIAKWLVLRLPLSLLLNPFEMFLAILCIISGVPLLLTATPQPDSLESLLPKWLVFLWGAELVVGGVFSFVGVVRVHRLMERFGMGLLGPAALAYAVGIFTGAGRRGSVAGAIVLAFGLACTIRFAVLTQVREVQRRAVEQDII